MTRRSTNSAPCERFHFGSPIIGPRPTTSCRMRTCIRFGGRIASRRASSKAGDGRRRHRRQLLPARASVHQAIQRGRAGVHDRVRQARRRCRRGLAVERREMNPGRAVRGAQGAALPWPGSRPASPQQENRSWGLGPRCPDPADPPGELWVVLGHIFNAQRRRITRHSAFDLKSSFQQGFAHALAKIALEFDGAVDDGTARAARPLQCLT
jgi:hypothetical protein